MNSEAELARDRLEAERQRLAKELCQLALTQAYAPGTKSEDAGYGNHLAEDASETFDKEQRLSLERNLRGILSQVDRALQKLEQGSYGLCDSCSQPIDAHRLEALPYANLCLECRERRGRKAPR